MAFVGRGAALYVAGWKVALRTLAIPGCSACAGGKRSEVSVLQVEIGEPCLESVQRAEWNSVISKNLQGGVSLPGRAHGAHCYIYIFFKYWFHLVIHLLRLI